MGKNKFQKRKILRHLGRIAVSAVPVSLMTGRILAVDPAEAAVKVMATEGGQETAKQALKSALKGAHSKPTMTVATTIACVACVPIAVAVASPGVYIACSILIAKTLG